MTLLQLRFQFLDARVMISCLITTTEAFFDKLLDITVKSPT